MTVVTISRLSRPEVSRLEMALSGTFRFSQDMQDMLNSRKIGRNNTKHNNIAEDITRRDQLQR